jgi:hypothetical protein
VHLSAAPGEHLGIIDGMDYVGKTVLNAFAVRHGELVEPCN